MNISYFNGKFIPKDEIHISPDDRGFLFADGIYEVVRWYGGFFYDIDGHMTRLKRSLLEIRIKWQEADIFPSVALELINRNNLDKCPSMVYLQVTRGVSKRAHAFPEPSVDPTVYAFAWGFNPEKELIEKGIGTILRKDQRWTRCDIKSVSLLPNILSFQEAREAGCYECIYSRDSIITECAHSNIFLVSDGTIFTHPESEKILSGITRKNILRLAHEAGIPVKETAIHEKRLNKISEAFVTNTSFEIAPVIAINKLPVSNGKPGMITKHLREKFDTEIRYLKG